MFTLDECQLDSILINQKDRIIRLINDGSFVAARAALDTVIPLWNSVGYAYKTREIEERLAREIAAALAK